MDYSLILLILILVTGVIYCIDKRRWEPQRQAMVLQEYKKMLGRNVAKQQVAKELTIPWYIDWSRSLFPVLLVVLLVRSCVVEPFQIPSGSMRPGLVEGDFLVVKRFIYGLRVPVWNQTVLPISEPKRGDVVVFKFPPNPSIDYIKRVIGLPGDQISIRNSIVYVNNKPLPQGQLERSKQPADFPNTTLYEESIGSKTYVIQKILTNYAPPERTWNVPAGHYFMMGDNRNNSRDSRFWGFVPEQNLLGEASFIWLNWLDWSSLPSLSRNSFID